MTYAELIQAMKDWVESNETTMVNNLDQIIEFAELRIYRTTDLAATWKYQTATLAADDEYLTLPSDTVVIRSIQNIDATSNDRNFLEQKDMSYLDEFNVDRDNTGTPRYWAWYNDTTLLIVPSPTANTTIEVAYTIRPTQLSSGNTTTWLSLNAPDVLLQACLLELAIFLKFEPDMIQNYTTLYSQSYQGTVIEENFRNRTDTFETNEVKVET